MEQRILRYFDRLAQQGFFGDVTFKFMGGRITLVTEEKRFKVEELSA